MKIGLYFGSFNPIHNGHLAIAEFMYRHFNFGEIWFVVSPSNPLKNKKDLLDKHKRLELVKAATKNNNYFSVSDIEFDMKKPSYTYLTLRKICAEFSQHNFAVLLGDDNINEIKLWKNYEEILRNYTIYVYPRAEKTSNFAQKNIIYTNPPILNISSTLIRKKIKNKENISEFVTSEVLQIIENENLYG